MLLVLATWVHTLAFVIAWGFYGVLGRMILPALSGTLGRPAQVDVLVAIDRRAMPFILLCVVLFAVTGTWLLLASPEYAGLGNLFASTWTTLMFAKHVLVVALVILGVLAHQLIARLEHAGDDAARAALLGRLRLATEGATALGAIIALLTVAAQASV